MVIILQFLCKIVPLKDNSLITQSIPIDPKHSAIKGLHYNDNIRQSIPQVLKQILEWSQSMRDPSQISALIF